VSRAGPEKTLQLEQDQKKRYLAAVGRVGTLTAGCKAARVSPHTVYQWRELDDAFVFAEREARNRCADELEAVVYRRAKNRSDILAIFLLKGMRPEKYRDRIGVEHSGSIGTDNELDVRIAARLAEVAASSQGPLALASGSET